MTPDMKVYALLPYVALRQLVHMQVVPLLHLSYVVVLKGSPGNISHWDFPHTPTSGWLKYVSVVS